MPYIPEMTINGVTYDIKDKRVNDLVTRLRSYASGYIDDDGNIVPRTYNFEVYTDYIPYTHNKIGVICQCDNANPMWASCAFYDSSKNHIITTRVVNAGATKIASGFVSVPSNAAYVRVSYRTFNDTTARTSLFGLALLMALDNYNDNANMYKSVSMYPTYAGYIDDDGSIHARTYNVESYTDYIPYTANKIGVVCKSGTAYPLWVAIAFYDSSKAFISRKRIVNESASKLASSSTSVPIGTAYVRVSYRWFNDASVTVNIMDDVLLSVCSSINELALTYIPNTVGYPVFVSREGIINGAIENSRTGIEQVRQYGYDMVRIDIQFTSDNVPVLFHDATLGAALPVYDSNGNTFTGSKISTYTYAHLQEYFFGSKTNPILTLEEAAALIKKQGLSVMLEIKDATVPTQSNIEAAYDIIAKNGLVDRSLWCVYSLAVAEYVTDIDDTCDCGYIQETISTATIDVAAQMYTGKNKVFFCAYPSSAEQFTDALHIYGAKNHVYFKMGSAYNESEIYAYRNYEMIEVANVKYPAYQLANYVE